MGRRQVQGGQWLLRSKVEAPCVVESPRQQFWEKPVTDWKVGRAIPQTVEVASQQRKVLNLRLISSWNNFLHSEMCRAII
jgi:hypothetical protein